MLIIRKKNRIKNALKTRGIAARKQEKERKVRLQELEAQIGIPIPLELREAVPDPQKLTTQDELDEQLRTTLIQLPEFSGVEYAMEDYEEFNIEEQKERGGR
ncbi:hypothetical protein VC83_04570 [Pseudogymnoascus destructans]|uniref:Uncharacterized protein n=1 Tax=Pseudogymnoascus destructans TaxID=655981 RepID=A0A177A899_9PEZI|nr:uncharacterized protein VC83_04570 [Pseudogymnoascus destructans]OAF57491.1 hypothetical protein VC83_04570 [Pseudogymnoascus destructans]